MPKIWLVGWCCLLWTVVGPDEAGAAERKKPSNADPCAIKLLGRWVGWIFVLLVNKLDAK